jgi:DNA-binding NtrC family response regulator
MWQTAQDSEAQERSVEPPVPGVLLVFHGAQPMLRALPIPAGGLVLGRELFGADCADDRLSRQHARVRVVRGQFTVTDLGSRNGTYVDRTAVSGEREVAPPAVLRTGRTVGVLLPDLRRFAGARVELREDGAGVAIVGPTLAAAWAQAERAARGGDSLLVTGESGTGKELAARAFHRAAGARGELIAVNCAAIPAGVAERLLFGARRGAYSGADKDADGYLTAAEGGTIFLDEIGELELAVQAKLLRALDAREILPVGASRPQRIDVRVVAATLRDLSAEVAAGRFRDDLYFRVGQPQVELPPLRHRPDDLAYLVAAVVERTAPGLAVHPSLIEACLLHRWPGNVRELVGQVRRAAFAAAEEGQRDVRDVQGLRDLPGDARPPRPGEPRDEPRDEPRPVAPLPPHPEIASALRAERGNISRAARALGLHRNQLRRYLAKHPQLAAEVGAAADSEGDPGDGGG